MGAKIGLFIMAVVLVAAGLFIIQFVGLLGLGILVVSLIFGFIIGLLLSKIKIKKEDKMIIKNAKEVLAGTRENILEIDGVKHEATKFVVRDEDDEDILIDLKGGVTTKHATKEKGTKQSEIPDCSPPRKDMPSIGKKKRDTRNRIRRFN